MTEEVTDTDFVSEFVALVPSVIPLSIEAVAVDTEEPSVTVAPGVNVIYDEPLKSLGCEELMTTPEGTDDCVVPLIEYELDCLYATVGFVISWSLTDTLACTTGTKYFTSPETSALTEPVISCEREPVSELNNVEPDARLIAPRASYEEVTAALE